MKIEIRDESTIGEIQEEFNRFYPFLRIELFNKSREKNEPNSSLDIISANKKAGAIRRAEPSGFLIVAPEKTVSEIEEDLRNKFGLNAQIFRKSGSLWIETSLTGQWTLKFQNDEGREITDKYKHGTSDSNYGNRDGIDLNISGIN